MKIKREHLNKEEPKVIIASAPARVDLAGGWTDGCTAYSQDGKPILGKVCNVAINLRSSVKIDFPENPGIWVHCNGLYEQLMPTNQYGGKLDLFLAAYNRYNLAKLAPSTVCYDWVHDRSPHILEIIAESQVPYNSGLGGSATVAVSLVAALTRFIGADKPYSMLSLDQSPRYDKFIADYKAWIATEARALEIEEMKVSSGWQDQGAAVYGGINFFEAIDDPQIPMHSEITRDPEIIELLQKHLLLVKTPRNNEHRSSNQVHEQVKILQKTRRVKLLEDMVKHAETCKKAILDKDMRLLGETVSQTWEAIDELTHHDASSSEIDQLIDISLRAGAYGAKACGAGSSGACVVIIAPPDIQDIILKAEQFQNGYEHLPIEIDLCGLKLSES